MSAVKRHLHWFVAFCSVFLRYHVPPVTHVERRVKEQLVGTTSFRVCPIPVATIELGAVFTILEEA